MEPRLPSERPSFDPRPVPLLFLKPVVKFKAVTRRHQPVEVHS